MVEFVTLLMGLVIGARPVEVAVSPEVAVVSMQLDGKEVGRLREPKWEMEIDFGPWIEPHRLEALAYDVEGAILGRAVQLVNYSTSNYGAVILLDNNGGASPRSGKVVWRAVLDRDPVEVTVRFDGAPVAVTSEGAFVLPRYPAGQVHHLEASLGFDDGSVARAEMTLGGVFGEEITSALTGVPVTSPLGEPWTKPQVQGWLLRDGVELPVFSIGEREGRLVILRDQDLVGHLPGVYRPRSGRGTYVPERWDLLNFDLTAISPLPLVAHEGTFRLSDLGKVNQRIGLAPVLVRKNELVRHDRKGDEKPSRNQAVWDALAVAGLKAATGNQPRAVVLMVGRQAGDDCLLTFEQSARYLESVRVPLFIWARDNRTLEALGIPKSERTFTDKYGLRELVRALSEELSSQTVIWLQGRHLPTEVELSTKAAPGVELVR